jgi:PadR family transcriptional regulator AphA
MLWIMSRVELSPVSYVVLGLVARDGPATPYALKSAVGRGVAYFWQFPHSQIYAETERLARLGLLAEEREQTGRRRRSYRITAQGRAALAAWLAEPASEPPQFRSLGLLKLYFSQHARDEDVAALARSQVELHRQFQEGVDGIIGRLRARGDRPGQLAVAELMADAFRAMAGHWQRIERALAEPPPAAAGEAGRS